MRFELRFSKRAVRDIEHVLAHSLKQFGERQYEQYKALIRDALSDIASDPFAAPAKLRAELHRDARMFHIARKGKPARHVFFYRIVGSQSVDVGRLLHDSMDFRRHLPKSFRAAEP